MATAVDWLKSALTVLSAAVVALLLLLVVREWSTTRVTVEALKVPETLAKSGLTAEVLSAAAIDQIAAVTAVDRFRWRGSIPGEGWATTDVNIPMLNVSVRSLVGLLKGFGGATDHSVVGEVIPAPAGKQGYVLTLRLKNEKVGWMTFTTPAKHAWTQNRSPAELFGEPVRALLLHTDPLSLASYDYVTKVEALAQEAPSQEARPPACHLHQRGTIIDAIGRCIGECGAKDKALAYLLWGDLLQKASELRGGDDTLLWDATERYANSVATADTTAVVYTHWAKALALLEHHDEAQAKFAEAVHAYPTDFLAFFDWAEYLSSPYSERSWRNISAKDDDRLREAAKLYRWSAWLDGTKDWTLTRLGQTLLMLDRREEAAQQFRAAISLNGSNTAARQGLCDALGEAEGEQPPPACSRAQAVRVALGSSTAPYRRPVQPPCAVDEAPAVLVSESIAAASPL